MTDDTPDSDSAHAVLLDLDRLLPAEVLRARVRRLIDERPPDPAWERFARHPLVMLALGFALTWGVGTQLTRRWEQAQLQSQMALEQARRTTEARTAIINDVFGTLQEHAARAFLVRLALDRGAPTSELADLVRAKRELFVKSSAQLSSIQFRLRGLLPAELYEQFMDAFDKGLYVRLQLIDQAQAIAFEDRLQRRRTPRLTPSKRDKALQSEHEVTRCSQEMANAIWFNAIAPTEASPPEVREKSLRAMNSACKLH